MLSLCLMTMTLAAAPPMALPPTPREALAPLGDLIGTWKGTGLPTGTLQEKQKGFWSETLNWQWKFKDKDAWLQVDIENGKHYKSGTLRHLADRDLYELKLTTAAKDTAIFTGKLDKKTLTLEREAADQTQRLTFTLLHSNRYLYRYEVKAKDRALFAKVYEVGATKEGVPFVQGDGKPECIVSGGAGTMSVLYMGKTYYVCCSGCRTEFLENPEKYIQEAAAKKK